MRFVAASARGSEGVTLPISSLIDVVFLLLIFFMVTSDFSVPERRLGGAAQLEGSGGAPSALQPQVVTIERAPDGVVYRIGERATTSTVELGRILAELPKEQGVAVRVRDDVPLLYAAAAMQAATDAGFEKRSYVPIRGE